MDLDVVGSNPITRPECRGLEAVVGERTQRVCPLDVREIQRPDTPDRSRDMIHIGSQKIACAALAAFLRDAIAADRFPMSSRSTMTASLAEADGLDRHGSAGPPIRRPETGL